MFWRKILITIAALSVVLAMCFASLQWWSTNYGTLTIGDVELVESKDVVVSKPHFQEMLTYAPSAACPRFTYLSLFGTSGNITLTPKDILIFYLYAGDGTGAEGARKDLEEQSPVVVEYNGNFGIMIGEYYSKVSSWTPPDAR